MQRTFVHLLLTALLLISGASEVFAHAVLQRSSPANGEQLQTAPPVMTLFFNEPVEAEFTPLTVRNRMGARVDQGDAAVDSKDRSLVFVSLPTLKEDLYSASYRITSLDGHVVEGVIAFAVGNVEVTLPTSSDTSLEVATTTPTGIVHGVVQWLAVLLAGLAAFASLMKLGAERLPGLVRYGAIALVFLSLAGLVEVGMYVARASGESLSIGLLLPSLIKTRTGRLWLLRTALALLTWLSIRLRMRLSDRLAWLSGAAMLLTLSIQSHAMASGEVLPLAMDWLHLLAAAPWVGGLFVLAQAGWPHLGGNPAQKQPSLLPLIIPHFSKIAILSVALLTITGLYSGMIHFSSLEALATTGHGRLLLIKLSLLMPVLALGAFHYFQAGRGAIRGTAAIEFTLMVAIFIAAGLLTSHPPAAVEMAARQGPFEGKAEVDAMQIALQVTPNKIGMNQATVRLNKADGAPESEAGVALRVRMPAHYMGTQDVTLREATTGVYQSEIFSYAMPGAWEVEVIVLTKRGREIRHPFTVEVPLALAP